LVPGAASAGRRTTSAAIADEAGHALQALDRWEQTHNPADYVRFVQGRAATATFTASELDVDEHLLRDAWASAPSQKQRAVLAAMSQLGVPYRNLKSEPGVGFDCSGLTIWAFAEAGVDLPRISSDQIDAAEIIERDGAVPGDLVYYPGHIGIYLGVETYVHSPNSGNDVEAVHLPSKALRFGDAIGDRDAPDSLVDGSDAVS
jgi:cell wall-associated NlpC family hydrolase